MSVPDFRSRTYNYREERFVPRTYPFDQEQGDRWAAFATTPGILPDTGGQAKLTTDNKLVVQLFDCDHENGFYVDDVIMLAKRMLASLRKDEYRQAAGRHLEHALVLLDDRVMQSHAYKDSPEEAATPPAAEMRMSSTEFTELHAKC